MFDILSIIIDGFWYFTNGKDDDDGDIKSLNKGRVNSFASAKVLTFGGLFMT